MYQWYSRCVEDLRIIITYNLDFKYLFTIEYCYSIVNLCNNKFNERF